MSLNFILSLCSLFLFLEVAYSPRAYGEHTGTLWVESDTPAGTTQAGINGGCAPTPVAVCEVTPEEIAQTIVLELRGANTGRDVISAMDASVLNPSDKAGLIRSAAMTDLELVESQSGIPSVALGRLGPPELSKLLFEAHLFKEAFGTMTNACASTKSSAEISQVLVSFLESSGVAKKRERMAAQGKTLGGDRIQKRVG